MAGTSPLEPSTLRAPEHSTYRHLYNSFMRHNAVDRNLRCSNSNHLRTTINRPRPQSRYCPSLSTSRLFRGCFPSVYAADAEAVETQTVSEKVANSRPKVHISDDEIEAYLAKETGMDRLREMFKKEDGDNFSPELTSIISVTEMCSIMTFVAASVIGAVASKEAFIKENKHTKFTTKFRAMRSFNDAIFIGGLKNGAVYGIKTGVFTLTFMGTSQCISVYRNKTSPTDYIAGAALTGGVFRMNLGLRGLVAGSIIGGALGAVGGLIVYGLMVAGNETQEQRHYWKIYDKLSAKREAEVMAAGARGESIGQPTVKVPT